MPVKSMRPRTMPASAPHPVVKKVNEMATRARNAAPARPPVRKEVTLPQPEGQLPLWPDDRRGFPNILARSALFSCSRDSVNREYFEKRTISTPKNSTIEYRGQELRQDDASVMMQMLHYARKYELGTEVEFTGYAFIKELGWSVNTASYDRLKECLERLSATNLTASSVDGRVGYGGSLVRKFTWRDSATKEPHRKWRVTLEPEIVRLFYNGSFSAIEWAERKKIGNRYLLALWLHSFYCSHSRECYPMHVSTYLELSGSRTKQVFHFRNELRKALERLVAIDFLASWDIDKKSDLVTVVRRPRQGLPELPALTAEAA